MKQANSEQKRLNALVLSLTNQLNEALQANAEQSRIIADLQSSLRISKKHRFGSPSQKGITKTKDVTSHDLSAIFHMIIETCKLLGFSAKKYINDFL